MVCSFVLTTSSSKADKLNSPVDASRVHTPKDARPVFSSTCSCLSVHSETLDPLEAHLDSHAMVRFVRGKVYRIHDGPIGKHLLELSPDDFVCLPSFCPHLFATHVSRRCSLERSTTCPIAVSACSTFPTLYPAARNLAAQNSKLCSGTPTWMVRSSRTACCDPTHHTHLHSLSEFEVEISVSDLGILLI